MNDASTRPSFYDSALSRADHDDFVVAKGIDGLQDEIAILRLRLRDALGDRPGDLDVVERGVRLLVQSLLAERRLSSKEARSLGDAVGQVVEQAMSMFTGRFE